MSLTPKLLHHVFSFYDQPTPLAVAAAGPTCRIACESRGVYPLSQTALFASLTQCDAEFDVITESAQEDELRVRFLRRTHVSAMTLLQPIIKADVLRQLSQTHAGLRIGHTLTFLISTAGEGGGALRIAEWQLEKKTDARCHGEDGTGEDGLCPSQKHPAVNDGLVRVVLLHGTQRVARSLLVNSSSEDNESASSSCTSLSCAESDEELRDTPSLETLHRPLPHAPQVETASGRQEDVKQKTAVETSTSHLPSAERWRTPVQSPPVEGLPPWGDPTTRRQECSSAASTQSATRHSSDESAADLPDDWWAEAMAAEAEAEEEEVHRGQATHSSRETARGGTLRPLNESEPQGTRTDAKPAALFKASTRATAPSPAAALLPCSRNGVRPAPVSESLPPLPADTIPPLAWWLNRPIGTAAAQQPSATEGGAPSLMATREGRAEALVGLCVHAHYVYPRWLDWLAAEVSPAVLLSLSLCSWSSRGGPLRPFSNTGEEGREGSRESHSGPGFAASSKPPAVPLPKRYGLPLRALFQESASAAFIKRIIRVIARDGALEHLELPYFESSGFLRPDRRRKQSGRKAESSLGRLLRHLRCLDLYHGSVTDEGLEQLLSAIAGPTGTSRLEELRLGGCSAIWQLGFCAKTPGLVRLELQRTAVDNAALLALAAPARKGHTDACHAQPPAPRVRDSVRGERDGQEEEEQAAPGGCTGEGCDSEEVGTSGLVLAGMRELMLGRCNVDEGLCVLPTVFPSLRSLDLVNSTVSEAGLAALVRASGGAEGHLQGSRGVFHLEKVDLDGCNRLTTLLPLWGLPTLQTVSACNCGSLKDVAGDGTQRAALLTSGLVQLQLRGCGSLPGTSLGSAPGRLGRWTLTTLNLDTSSITDEGLRLLCGRPSFGQNGRPPTHSTADEGGFAPCEALECLSLRLCSALRSLGVLGTLPSLRVLKASGCHVGSSGLTGLSRSAFLEVLDLAQATAVDDITPLAYVPTLRCLILSRAESLTDDSLLRFVFAPPTPSFASAADGTRAVPPVRGCYKGWVGERPPAVVSRLEFLDLYGCRGIRMAGCLAHLPSLKSLRIGCSRVFDASLYGFFASRAGLLTWRHRDGFDDDAFALPERAEQATREAEGVGGVADDAVTRPGSLPDLVDLRQRFFRAPMTLLSTSGAMHLHFVDLQSSHGVRSIEPLGLLPRLRSLCLEMSAVDSASLRGFVHFHVATTMYMAAQASHRTDATTREGFGLLSLSLARCKYVTDIGCLCAIPSLRSLDVTGSPVENDSLVELATGRGRFVDAFLQLLDSVGGGAAGGRGGTTWHAFVPRADHEFLQLLRRSAGCLRDSCSALRVLKLSGCPHVFGTTHLLDLPALKELWLLMHRHTFDEDLVAALREKGVRVFL